MQQLNETTNRAKESGTGFFSNMLSSAGGFIAANVVGAITSQVSNFVGSIGTVMSAQQDQMAQLQAGLESTGGKAGVTIDMLTQLADAQAKQTKFSVAQTEAIEKVGLTFTSINKDVFPQTVSLAEDMSARLGIQGSAAMTMLGKAMDDPLKGMAALHRVGVSFTEEQKNQVKALLAVGDTMGAQKIILAELGTEYGGSAVAAGKTFSGQQEIINHQMDELKVKIGTAVMPILGQLMGFVSTNLMPVFERFADWFVSVLPGAIEKVKTTVGPFIDTFGQLFNVIVAGQFDLGTLDDLLSNVIPPDLSGKITDIVEVIMNLVASFQSGGAASSALGAKVNDLASIWAALQPVITNVTDAIGQVVNAVFGQIQTFLDAHGADISATMQEAWTRIMGIIKQGIELYNAIVPPVLRFIASFIQAHGKEIQTLLSSAWSSIKATIDAVLTLIEGVIKVALDVIHGNWEQAWEDLKTMSARIVLDLWTIIKNGLDNVVTVFGGTWTKIKDGVGQFVTVTIPSLASSIIDGLVTGIENGGSAIANAVWQMVKDAVSSAIASLGGGSGPGSGSNSASPRVSSQSLGSAGTAAQSTSFHAAPITVNAAPGQSPTQIAKIVGQQQQQRATLRRA